MLRRAFVRPSTTSVSTRILETSNSTICRFVAMSSACSIGVLERSVAPPNQAVAGLPLVGPVETVATVVAEARRVLPVGCGCVLARQLPGSRGSAAGGARHRHLAAAAEAVRPRPGGGSRRLGSGGLQCRLGGGARHDARTGGRVRAPVGQRESSGRAARHAFVGRDRQSPGRHAGPERQGQPRASPPTRRGVSVAAGVSGSGGGESGRAAVR